MWGVKVCGFECRGDRFEIWGEVVVLKVWGSGLPVWSVQLSFEEPYKSVQWLRGGLAFVARRLLYLSTPGLRVIKKKKKVTRSGVTSASLRAGPFHRRPYVGASHARSWSP